MPTQHLSPANAGSTQVIALHCSGAGAAQWRQLGETLGPAYQLFAPEHYGCERTGPWSGKHAFTLADEAEKTIDLIDRSERKVHLVGHSYGGGVALHAALARPGRIASLALYEGWMVKLNADPKGGIAFDLGFPSNGRSRIARIRLRTADEIEAAFATMLKTRCGGSGHAR